MKTLVVLTAVLAVPKFPLFSEKTNLSLKERIHVMQMGKEVPLDSKTNKIESDAFDIVFDGIDESDAICLFAYHNSSYESAYHLPIAANDTEIFRGGTGLAESSLDKGKGYCLSLNKVGTMHYIVSERRTNTNRGAIIPVRAIADPTGNFENRLCLSFFVDFNKNNIIAPDEYAYISLYFPNPERILYISTQPYAQTKAGDNLLPKEAAFIPSRCAKIKKENCNGKDFAIYRIKNSAEFRRFCSTHNDFFIGKTFEDFFPVLKKGEFETQYPIYMLFVPKGKTLFTNPYRLINDPNLYFPVRDVADDEEICYGYRYIKSISVGSSKPVFICNGRTISVPVQSP